MRNFRKAGGGGGGKYRGNRKFLNAVGNVGLKNFDTRDDNLINNP